MLLLVLQGCSSAEIGPYATDDFKQKYSYYADFYNMALYSGNGIGAWMDEYELAFYSAAQANFDNQFLPVDLSTFSEVTRYAKDWSQKQPVLDPLDKIVKESTLKSEQLVSLMYEVQEYYAHDTYLEDDFTWIKQADSKLQGLADELSALFTAMETELVRVRKEADSQLIIRYESSGDDLSADLVRVMRLYDNFSEYVTTYMLDEAVDLTVFEDEIEQTDSLRSRLLTLSEKAGHLSKAKRTKEQIDQFADAILQGEQTLRHMLATMRQGNALLEDDLFIFETIYNSMVEQLNQVNE